MPICLSCTFHCITNAINVEKNFNCECQCDNRDGACVAPDGHECIDDDGQEDDDDLMMMMRRRRIDDDDDEEEEED